MKKFEKLENYLDTISKKFFDDYETYRDYKEFVSYTLSKLENQEKLIQELLDKIEALDEKIAGKQDIED